MAVVCIWRRESGLAEGSSARRRGKGAHIHYPVCLSYRKAATVNGEAVSECSGGGSSEAVAPSHLLFAVVACQVKTAFRQPKVSGDALACAGRHREGRSAFACDFGLTRHVI